MDFELLSQKSRHCFTVLEFFKDLGDLLRGKFTFFHTV